jgi:TonB family protein
MMRSSVLASGAVHLLVLGALFAVRTQSSLVVPGPDIVQVALLDQPSTPAPVVAPPPKPVEKEPEIKPNEPTGVKLAKPKPTPPPKQPPKKEERAPETAAPALPYAAVGPAGLKAQVALDDKNFEFTYYLVLVRNRIAANWTPPGGVAGATHAVVYFRIGRDGSVAGARIENGSGNEFFDLSAVRAVTISDPLPPLPLGYSGGDLGVHFGFEVAGP